MSRRSNPEKRLSQRELYKLDNPRPPRPPSQEFLWRAQLVEDRDPDNFKAFNPHARPRDPEKDKKKKERANRRRVKRKA